MRNASGHQGNCERPQKKKVSRTTYNIIGSLSNYDDDHNNDFNKTIGLMIKTTALQVHHAF